MPSLREAGHAEEANGVGQQAGHAARAGLAELEEEAVARVGEQHHSLPVGRRQLRQAQDEQSGAQGQGARPQ